MIHVTKSFLPPQKEYNEILKEAWDNYWITNNGVLHKRLHASLLKELTVSNLILTTNGTLPIQIAIKAMGLKGEIITTPFSYVATTSAIVWENCKPVFVDIDPDYLTIDETKIEAAITKNTSAILATHVYGNPCNVKVIESIANKHGLAVIYDAAHCYGVELEGESVFNYGDVSTCSFHATKIFHTGEGGALFCNDEKLFEKCFYHHNFGHNGPEEFHGIGINAKMSELQAAMGLAVLPYMHSIIESRKLICDKYEQLLKNNVQFIIYRNKLKRNYSYFPIILKNQEELEKVKAALEEVQVFPRRYFYPTLNHLPYVDSAFMPVSESISERILCLPLYKDLKMKEVIHISEIILGAL